MNGQKSKPSFLLILLLAILVVIFFVFRPFLNAIILAAIFAVAFFPLYRKTLSLTRGRQWLAALVTSTVVVVLILLPLVLLGMQIFQEARHLYIILTEESTREKIFTLFKGVWDNIQRFIPISQEFHIDIEKYLAEGLNWLIKNLGDLLELCKNDSELLYISYRSLFYV